MADAFAADITNERQVADLVAAVTDRLGPIDVLVLNATGPQPEALLTAVAWDDHLAQLEYFVKSPTLLARAVLPAMQARGFGRIIQIDSEVVDRRSCQLHHRPKTRRRRRQTPSRLKRRRGPSGSFLPGEGRFG